MSYLPLFQKNYSPEKIIIRHSKVQRPSTEELESIIHKNWETLVKENPNVFNGICYRLISYEAAEELTLSVSTLQFKEAKGLPLQILEASYPDEYHPHSLCCSLFIETSDNFIIFGQKKGKDLIVGGSYSPEEIPLKNGHDIFAMARLELFEETGITEETLTSLTLAGLARTHNLNLALIFNGQTTLSKDQVYSRFSDAHDPEFDNLCFIKRADLSAYFDTKHLHRKELLTYLQS